jgi:hypothetical protein
VRPNRGAVVGRSNSIGFIRYSRQRRISVRAGAALASFPKMPAQYDAGYARYEWNLTRNGNCTHSILPLEKSDDRKDSELSKLIDGLSRQFGVGRSA